MEKIQKNIAILDQLSEDPVIRLPVDQKSTMEFDELVVNNLEDYKKRKIIFKNDPEVFTNYILFQNEKKINLFIK